MAQDRMELRPQVGEAPAKVGDRGVVYSALPVGLNIMAEQVVVVRHVDAGAASDSTAAALSVTVTASEPSAAKDDTGRKLGNILSLAAEAARGELPSVVCRSLAGTAPSTSARHITRIRTQRNPARDGAAPP